MAQVSSPLWTCFFFLIWPFWCGLSLGSDLNLVSNADSFKAIPLPDLHHHTAGKLCFALENTPIRDQFKFLWSLIQPKDEQKKVEMAPQNCRVYRWKKCSGEVRFPLSAECGFFESVQLPAVKCDQSTNANDQGITYVNHARAVQLCAIFNELPEEKEPKLRLDFTPILVDTEKSGINSLVQKCVFWKLFECGAASDDEPKEGCGQWSLAINPIAECKPYLKYDAPENYNRTEIQRLIKDKKNEDFIQSTAKDENDADFGSEMNLLKDLISCESSGESTTCQIMDQLAPSGRQKRELSHTNNIRKKRQYYRRGRGRGRQFRCSSLWYA